MQVRLKNVRRRKGLSVESLESRHLLVAGLVISEFSASNDDAIDDGNGESSDWIEIFNPGTETVDLSGYRLTDDPRDLGKWVFPAADLDPNQYLVVFASDQLLPQYVDPLGYLP